MLERPDGAAISGVVVLVDLIFFASLGPKE
jgi:hypothetical protein